MRRPVVCSLLLAGMLAAASAPARAQTCLGFPSFAAGQLNVSATGRVGGRFWGSVADVNVGRRSGGIFGGTNIATISYIDEPTETRISYGATLGYEFNRRDQLIVCPFAIGVLERGRDVDLGEGRTSKTTGELVSIGIAVAGETGRGVLTAVPFLSARYTEIRSEVSGDSTLAVKERGFLASAGLGIRITDAFQITPLFSFGTFPRQDLVFNLRLSLSLQFRRAQ